MLEKLWKFFILKYKNVNMEKIAYSRAGFYAW